MNTHPSVRTPIGLRAVAAAWVAATLLAAAPLSVRGGPFFVFPDPTATHPGAIPLIAPLGPTPLAPGGTLGPTPFMDTVASLDFGHWEVEIANVLGIPLLFDVTFTFPGGPVTGGLFIPPGGSMYFDVGYLDAPPEVGPPLWLLSAASSLTMPGMVLIDTDAIETPVGPIHGLGVAAAIPGGAPGSAFGPAFGGGVPSVSLSLLPVPEPGSLALLLIGALGLRRVTRRAARS
jgi:hypothetical protein